MQHRRPTKFVPAGDVLYSELCKTPPFIAAQKRKPKEEHLKRGVRYETQVQRHFESLYGPRYVPSPWVRFHSRADTDSNWRYCQPDGLLVDVHKGCITIVEIKLKHTTRAWWQVRELYEPVVKNLFNNGHEGHWQFAACEVVKWYDTDTFFPENILLTPAIENVPPGYFGLHIWSTRGRSKSSRRD